MFKGVVSVSLCSHTLPSPTLYITLCLCLPHSFLQLSSPAILKLSTRCPRTYLPLPSSYLAFSPHLQLITSSHFINWHRSFIHFCHYFCCLEYLDLRPTPVSSWIFSFASKDNKRAPQTEKILKNCSKCCLLLQPKHLPIHPFSKLFCSEGQDAQSES